MTRDTRPGITEFSPESTTRQSSNARTHSGVHHWFRSGDDWCAASWHVAARPLARVAVLCPSIAQEHLRGQREFRLLAVRLAAAGVSTLRFDYPATGNSTGEAIAPDGLESDLAERWCAAICDAVAHARLRLPGAEVVLVGRRLGALLAARASASIDGGIAAAVMWEPSVSGVAQLRELRLREAARLDTLFANELDRMESGVAFQTEGHRFDAATVAGISALSLESLRPHTRDVHLVGAITDRVVRATERWSDGDDASRITTHRTSDATFDWAKPEGPKAAEETLAVIERIAVGEALPAPSPEQAFLPPSEPDEIPIRRAGARAARERLLRFGVRDECFGVHSAPEQDGTVSTAVLLLGTGIEPTPGFGDSWTRFARSAAQRGIAVLRMDFRGIGESVVARGGQENVSYQTGRVDDVREGVAWLRSRWPAARIIVAGICTGGYYAIHSAADGANVDRVIAINPQLWCTDSSTVDQRFDESLVLARRAGSAANDSTKWMRLIRGGYRWEDISRAARGFVQSAVSRLPVRRRDSETLGGGMPRLDLERLFPDSVPTHLIFSQDDFGYEHILAHGEKAARRLFGAAHIRLSTIEGSDHTFSREWMRRRLDQELLESIGAK